MKRQSSNLTAPTWHALDVPPAEPPRPVVVRVQFIPARHYFPAHTHGWNQLVYAVSGVLTVATEGSCLVVPPEQAVWLRTGTVHRVASLHGAEFRSLYVAEGIRPTIAQDCTVFEVSPLLRALIVEAASLRDVRENTGYAVRVIGLILDQLRRLEPVSMSLPWPKTGAMLTLCETLYAAASDSRSIEEWGLALGMSSRTLSRRFERDVGMTLREWRHQLRLFRAVELLGGGATVTQAAFELGYSSASAFVYMFRTATGRSPMAHRRAALK